MNHDWLIIVELVFVFGVALAFGIWQLWDVRRGPGSKKDPSE